MKDLTLELNINSASDLENVNYITKMNVYAVITLLGDKKIHQKVKTGVDRYGGSNPNWNHAVKFPVNERLAREGRLTLVVGLFSSRLLGDKDIGKVEVPLVYLLPSTNGNGNDHGMKFATYQVRTPSEKMKGSLTFSYRIPFISGQPYQQVPASWASPTHGYGPYGPYGYMPQPPPPPQYTKDEEIRLQKADLVISALSLFR
ncbi:Calcium-dependent lipid-binding (CaLB domain) family protein [Raphanus sativus]|uniref:Protein SRC2-like n=1 Tax=Raphanus sativus TaxID=3726 RepID=A0A6J0NZG2_RAPSA|nr:protein SRC2-like [Raphanus sativus]KAJ4898636.1 Calcium-dependent lipid-binding (CaLB domain) family protein [Raphanus sativus]